MFVECNLMPFNFLYAINNNEDLQQNTEKANIKFTSFWTPQIEMYS